MQSRKVFEGRMSYFDLNDDVVIDNDLLHRERQGNYSERTKKSIVQTENGSIRKNSIINGLPIPPTKKIHDDKLYT